MLFRSQESALLAASALGYPVAVKGLSRQVSHKSDAGLVALDVTDDEQLLAAFEKISTRLGRQDGDENRPRLMVQRMLSGGREVIIGGKRDTSFGPVVMFGLGGVYVEALEDVVFRLAPLSRGHARQMVNELHGSDLLYGVRGEPPVDLDAVLEALLSMSNLLIACPEIVEVEINPLLVRPADAAAIDARAVLRRQGT